MILQYVAVGSMIIMAGVAASQVLREAFGPPDHHRGHDRIEVTMPRQPRQFHKQQWHRETRQARDSHQRTEARD